MDGGEDSTGDGSGVRVGAGVWSRRHVWESVQVTNLETAKPVPMNSRPRTGSLQRSSERVVDRMEDSGMWELPYMEEPNHHIVFKGVHIYSVHTPFM